MTAYGWPRLVFIENGYPPSTKLEVTATQLFNGQLKIMIIKWSNVSGKFKLRKRCFRKFDLALAIYFYLPILDKVSLTIV